MVRVYGFAVLMMILGFALPGQAVAQSYSNDKDHKYQSVPGQYQYNFRPSANGLCRDYTANIHDGGGRQVIYGTVCPGPNGEWVVVRETTTPRNAIASNFPTRTLMNEGSRGMPRAVLP